MFFPTIKTLPSQYHHCRLVLGSFQKMYLSLQTIGRNLIFPQRNQLHRKHSLGRKTLPSFAQMFWIKCATEMVVKRPGGCEGQQCWSWSLCTAVRVQPGRVYFPLLQQGHLQTLAGDQLLHGHPREPDVGIGKLAWAVWCPTPLSSAQQHLKAAQQTGYSYISCRSCTRKAAALMEMSLQTLW